MSAATDRGTMMFFILRAGLFPLTFGVAFLGAAVGLAQAGILPPDRDAGANWRMAGMLSVGGIPQRSTVCATVSPRGGGSDDTTNIQNAIKACPIDQVVQLTAGAF